MRRKDGKDHVCYSDGFLASCTCQGGRLRWQWHRAKWRAAVNRDGAYLLRAHWPGGLTDPTRLLPPVAQAH